MAFDPMNPLASFGIEDDDPYEKLRKQYALLQQQSQAQGADLPPQAISPDDYNSLLSSLGTAPLSALSYIGDTLGKPGRTIRGLIGAAMDGSIGEAGQALLQSVPFSDTLGLTESDAPVPILPTIADKSQIPGGRQLLEKANIVNPKGPDDDFDGSDLAGIGVNIATDPLTYLGLGLIGKGSGALGEGGKIAEAAGLMPTAERDLATGMLSGAGSRVLRQTTTLGDILSKQPEAMEAAQNAAKGLGINWTDDVLNQPLGGLAKLTTPQLPFLPHADITGPLGTGPIAQKIGGALDTMGDYLRYGNPVGRKVGQLFSKAAGNVATGGGQLASELASQESSANSSASKLAAAQQTDQLTKAGLNAADPAVADQLRQAAEAKDLDAKIRQVMPEASQPTAAPAPPQGGIPVFITRAMRQQLADAGFTPEEVRQMTPQQAWDHLNAKATAGAQPLSAAQQTVKDVVGDIRSKTEANLAAGRAMGMEFGLDDTENVYAPRTAAPFGEKSPAAVPNAPPQAGPTFNTNASTLKARTDALKNIPETDYQPGGTVGLNKFFSDNRLFGDTRSAAMDTEGNYHAMDPEQLTPKEGGGYNETTPDKVRKEIVAKEYLGVGDQDYADAKNYEKQLQETKGQKLAQLTGAGLDPDMASKVVGNMTNGDLIGEDRAAALEAHGLKMNQASEMLKIGDKLPPQFSQGAKLYPNDPVTDAMIGNIKTGDTLAHMKHGLNYIGSVAEHGGEGPGLMETLRKVKNLKDPVKGILQPLVDSGKFTEEEAGILRAGKPAAFKESVLPSPASASIAPEEQAAHAAAIEAAKAENAAKVEAYKAAKEKLDGMTVGQQHADALQNVMDFTGGSPKSVGAIMKLWNSATSAFKAGVTAVFPANKVRDTTTGIWQALATDSRDPNFSRLDPRAWTSPDEAAKAFQDGTVWKNANKIPGLEKMSPEEATQWVMQQRFAHGMHDAQSLPTGEWATGQTAAEPIAAGGLKSPVAQMVNPEPINPWRTLKESVIGDEGLRNPFRDPLGIRGVQNMAGEVRTEDTQPLIKAGRELTDQIYQRARDRIFAAHLLQGKAPAEAAAIAKGAMVDFGNLTPFERNVVQKVVPFWAWNRHQIPWQLHELLNHPGGLTATAVKQYSNLASDRGFIPKQLSGDLAIPLGSEDKTGNKKYLTGSNLPFESLEELFQGGRNTQDAIQNTLAGWAGNMNPLFKVPIEMATNRQLYSGRELTDLKGRVGTTLENLGLGHHDIGPTAEEVLANSPVSRVLSTFGKLTDPRKSIGEKALNTLTGFSTSDIDMQQARENAARDAVDKLMQGAEGVHKDTSLYVRKEDLPNLTPEQAKLYSLYQQIGKQRQQRAQDEKKRQALAGVGIE